MKGRLWVLGFFSGHYFIYFLSCKHFHVALFRSWIVSLTQGIRKIVARERIKQVRMRHPLHTFYCLLVVAMMVIVLIKG